MSRSNYNTDYSDNWALICWRGAVASAIRGNRGQAFLRELRDALDALPEKNLIAHDLSDGQGNFCALGTVMHQRGIEIDGFDPEDDCSNKMLAKCLGIAEALVREIEFENDEGTYYPEKETPERRWTRVRAWVEKQISGEVHASRAREV